MTQQIIEVDYGAVAQMGIPNAMKPWNLRLEQPYPTDFGEYVVVDIQQAGIELHHQVEVIDEDGDPLSGVWVIFGYPAGGGKDFGGLQPSGQNYWRNAPTVINGNAQKTPITGYAQHTFHSGGEDIWIMDVDGNGDLKLPSVIVKNCEWRRTPVGMFEHTGVKVTFQRRRAGYVPVVNQLEMMAARIAALEEKMG